MKKQKSVFGGSKVEEDYTNNDAFNLESGKTQLALSETKSCLDVSLNTSCQLAKCDKSKILNSLTNIFEYG